MSQPLAFVIEDDEIVAGIFVAAVEAANYRAEMIRDGDQALERLKTSVPDLVVLDLRLPKVHGIHVLKAIREDQRLKNTRVVVVSADATQSQFLRDEADLVLIKPIGFNQLREMSERLRPDTD
jgi:CheY-like chemotaxis protein